jgi:hypothetical protein
MKNKNGLGFYHMAIDAAINSTNEIAKRDNEFLNQFGNWKRPEFARRYDLDSMKNLINWSVHDKTILDVAPFIKRLAKEDQYIAGEIAKFCEEEIHDKFCTDSNLKIFRLNFIRRLDACGF